MGRKIYCPLPAPGCLGDSATLSGWFATFAEKISWLPRWTIALSKPVPRGPQDYREEYLEFARQIIATPAMHRRGGIEWANRFIAFMRQYYPKELDRPEADKQGQSLLFGKANK